MDWGGWARLLFDDESMSYVASEYYQRASA
jgi:hypothetical protein